MVRLHDNPSLDRYRASPIIVKTFVSNRIAEIQNLLEFCE